MTTKTPIDLNLLSYNELQTIVTTAQEMLIGKRAEELKALVDRIVEGSQAAGYTIVEVINELNSRFPDVNQVSIKVDTVMPIGKVKRQVASHQPHLSAKTPRGSSPTTGLRQNTNASKVYNILRSTKRGVTNQKEIAERAGIPKGSITWALNNLIEKGLIVRLPNDSYKATK